MTILQDSKIARAHARPQGRSAWMYCDDTIHDSKIARANARLQGSAHGGAE